VTAIDRETLKHLTELGLVEMKPTGQYGLTREGVTAARAFRVLDDLFAAQTGQLKTRRDVRLDLEERTSGP
jgi:hypothetical protein